MKYSALHLCFTSTTEQDDKFVRCLAVGNSLDRPLGPQTVEDKANNGP